MKALKVENPLAQRNVTTEGRPEKRPVLFACDEAYAMPLATVLRSVVESNQQGWPVEFHVFSSDMRHVTRQKILDSLPAESASVRWETADMGRFEGFATLPHISKATYARLLIPQVLDKSVSRILYLDADLLVLDDLGALWETNLDGAVVGAVSDGTLDPVMKSNGPGWEGVPRVREYFNAGVLLVDLQRWREERISEKALDYLQQHPQSPFSDQDALNVACDNLWQKLEPRWNVQNHWGKSVWDIPAGQKPGIIHFVTSGKPWDASTRSVNASFYDSFRSRTRFARTRVDKLVDSFRGTRAGVQNVLRRRGLMH